MKGLVQGVYYRASAMECAIQLKLAGYVCNTGSGDVLIEVEGEEEQVNEFVFWCKTGSPKSNVEDVLVSEGNLVNYDEFQIKYGQ